jgi:DNA-binding transcriptional regulator YdaS (Cro superfamily)
MIPHFSTMNKIVLMITGDTELRRRIIAAARRSGDPLTEQALSDWKKLRKGVPPRRVKMVARITGLAPHQIRPDIFPRP